MTCPYCDSSLRREWYDDLPYLSCENGHAICGVGPLIDFILDLLEKEHSK